MRDLLKKQQEFGTPKSFLKKTSQLNSTLCEYQQKYNQKQSEYAQFGTEI
jgi:hypothetical protein